MRHLSNFIRVFGVSFSLLTASVVFADEAVSVKEADALIKDDIANAQVLIEMCPTLIGKNAKFDQNIKQMVASYLSNYSDKSASIESLQKDGEFQSLLKDAREAAKEVEKSEQKSVCEDVLNFEG
ncbi:MCR_0457 family protein [Acinetobacter beijerinckii]|uniref:MCR_0457 family protein n=1 Tax=Acinetobacter beijerinckii TaxID=262668 RepID=UPI003AF7A485